MRHSKLKMPDGDVLVHAGDFSMRGGFTEFEVFFKWLEDQEKRYKHVVWVCGNHDGFPIEKHGRKWMERSFNRVPGIYLQEKAIHNVCGLSFYGTPYTPAFRDWSFMALGEGLYQHAQRIPDVDVVVSHGPAFGIGDMNDEYTNCGDGFLRDRLARMDKLKLHVFGHIHDGYGMYDGHNGIRVNASSLDYARSIVRDPVVIDIDRD